MTDNTSSALAPVNGMDTRAFVALLKQQVAVFEQLDGYAQQQETLINEGRADELLTVLGRRQELINTLNGLNDQAEPFRRGWTQFSAGLDEAERSEIGELLKQVQSMLAEIIQRDERDRTELQQQRGKVSKELQQVSQVGAAMNAYGGAKRAYEPRFADKQG